MRIVNKHKYIRLLVRAAAYSTIFLCSSCDTSSIIRPGSLANNNNKKSHVICRAAAAETGSRMSGPSICHTEKEWVAIDAQKKQENAKNGLDKDKFFRRQAEQSSLLQGSGLDNPNQAPP